MVGGQEICNILGYRDTNDATKYLDSDEVSTCTDNASGQVRHLKIINEPGLYSLIIRSRKLEARAIKETLYGESATGSCRLNSLKAVQSGIGPVNLWLWYCNFIQNDDL